MSVSASDAGRTIMRHGDASVPLARASIVTGPESHPDPSKRWLVAWPYLVFYILVGLAAATFVAILGSLPRPLIAAIAGLALFAPLLGSATAMWLSNRLIAE